MVRKFPNEVMLSQAERDELHRLFRTVEATPEFRKIRHFRWWIFWRRYWWVNGSICSRDEIEEQINHNAIRDMAWPEELRRSLPPDLKSVAEFTIGVYDRTGLEDCPSHVGGWVYHFYVNPQSGQLLYWMRGPFST